MTRKLIAAALVGGGVALAGPALAQDAVVVTDLNMRAGPGPEYEVITAIPGNESVVIHGCTESMSWCQVSWGGQQGWAFAEYIAYADGADRVVVAEAGPRFEIPIISDVARATGSVVAATGEAVGTVVGGVAGAAASIVVPPHVRTYVVEREVEPVVIEREVVVGETLPDTVVLHEIPDYEYRYAFVNDRRVLVEPGTHRVVHIIG